MKITNKKLKELITEEGNAAKMYRGYGFYGLSKQESGHRKFLKKKLRERRKK